MPCITAHMQDAVGACLSATVSRIGEGIKVGVRNLADPIGVSLRDMVDKHLNVRCSIVCSISEVVDYLRVSPSEVQWITDDIGVFFDVESNVDWIVVTS